MCDNTSVRMPTGTCAANLAQLFKSARVPGTHCNSLHHTSLGRPSIWAADMLLIPSLASWCTTMLLVSRPACQFVSVDGCVCSLTPLLSESQRRVAAGYRHAVRRRVERLGAPKTKSVPCQDESQQRRAPADIYPGDILGYFALLQAPHHAVG
jgi:hypothetical protein